MMNAFSTQNIPAIPFQGNKLVAERSSSFFTSIHLSANKASEYKRESLWCVISALPPPSQVLRAGAMGWGWGRGRGIIIYPSLGALSSVNAERVMLDRRFPPYCKHSAHKGDFIIVDEIRIFTSMRSL